LSRSHASWIALSLSAACTTTTTAPLSVRARADASSRLTAIRTAVLVPMDVKEYEVSAGGVPEFKEEWSTAARQALEDALIGQLKSRRIELRRIEPDAETAEEIQDLRKLAEAVNASLRFRGNAFDFSLGTVAPVLDRYGADALVFVWARGRMMSGGRKFMAVLSGGGANDTGLVTITLVDRTGDVVWCDSRGRVGSNADLRQADSAVEVVRAILSDLPSAQP
jgi:hypothetical protein